MSHPTPGRSLNEIQHKAAETTIGSLKTAADNVGQNSEVTLFSSAARAEGDSPFTTADQSNTYARGVEVFLDVTAASGTSPTLDVKLQAKDPASGSYFDIPGASFAQQSGTTSLALTVYPGVAETANEGVSDVIPKTWRAHAAVGSGSSDGSFTFTLGASYII